VRFKLYPVKLISQTITAEPTLIRFVPKKKNS